MRLRRALVVAIFVACGCQDKKPDAPPAPPDATPAEVPTAAATTTTAPAAPAVPELPPAEGTLDGKPFRPATVTIDETKDGPVLMFHQTEGQAESSIGVINLPAKEGERLGGKEWTLGGKADDPLVLLMRPEWKDPKAVTDYTLTVRLGRQTADTVEGSIDLTVKNPAGTALKGSFKAAYRRSPTGPLGPADAPFVRGKIVVKDAKKTEKLAAGYVGVGTDGQPYFNEAGFPVVVGEPGYSTAPSPQKATQTSWLASEENSITYRHLNVPPGDYLVYLRRDTVMSAWKRIKLKDGDQKTIDLTIDPATTGEVVVTVPEPAAADPAESSLSLVPAKANLPELGLGSEHYFNVATVKKGDKTVKLSGIPAGKYRAVLGTNEAEVEVVAGKSAAVTLVPPKK